MRRANPEQALHRAVAHYLSVALTPASFFTTIGHGGGGHLRGAILHGVGMKAGVPDLLIVNDGCAHFLELKAAEGRVSAAQKDVCEQLRAAGARPFIARNLDDVKKALLRWDIPTRDVFLETQRLERAA